MLCCGKLCDQDGEARIVDGQIMIVSNAAPTAPGMYREPFDGIQLRKLPEPPPLLPSEVPGNHFCPIFLPVSMRLFVNRSCIKLKH